MDTSAVVPGRQVPDQLGPRRLPVVHVPYGRLAEEKGETAVTDYIFVNATDPDFGIELGPTLLYVHDPAKCEGQTCCIHHPSDHHMVTWPQNWRADREMMERICPEHGVGHPDPDDLNTETTHSCCGCCKPPMEGGS